MCRMHHAFALDHDVFLPRELVFEVWVDPAHLEGWYPAPDQRLIAANGTWRVLDAAGGVVEEVRPRAARAPERLEWEVAAGDAAGVLTVTFGGGRGTCNVAVARGDFADAAERDRQEALWRQRLRRLEQYFAAI